MCVEVFSVGLWKKESKLFSHKMAMIMMMMMLLMMCWCVYLYR